MLIIFLSQLVFVSALVFHPCSTTRCKNNGGNLKLSPRALRLSSAETKLHSTDENHGIDENIIASSSPSSLSSGAKQSGRQQMDFQLQDNFSIWPCGDALDKNIAKLLFPAIMNYGLVPLVGAADTFWVGRMRDSLALAGQGAANQLFNSAFWFFSFLPNVVTPLIAKANGANDEEALQDRVAEAFYIALFTGIIGTLLLTVNPKKILSLVLPIDSAARAYAEPYLFIRGLTVLPALFSSVGFAVFRGTLDVSTPLKISLLANLVNVVLDPLLIFPAKLGVVGAAVATCLSDLASFIIYTKQLMKRRLLQRVRTGIPSLKNLMPVLLGGASMQLRSIALNTAMIAVTRTAQRLDSTAGTVAAAHTISLQMFQLGSVASLAMGTVAAIIIPLVIGKSSNKQLQQNVQTTSDSSQLQSSTDGATTATPAQIHEYHALTVAKQSADRILIWGGLLGGLLALSQYVAAGTLLKFFSPLDNVQSLAKGPSTIGAVLQWLNCIVWTGEGLQQGHSEFLGLAISTILGTVGMMSFIKYFVHHPSLSLSAETSLSRVWLGFVVLSSIRLVATMYHHFISGPLSLRRLKKHPGRIQSTLST